MEYNLKELLSETGYNVLLEILKATKKMRLKGKSPLKTVMKKLKKDLPLNREEVEFISALLSSWVLKAMAENIPASSYYPVKVLHEQIMEILG